MISADTPDTVTTVKVLQVGNHGPSHSTESHLAIALEYNGVEVIRAQENNVDIWRELAREVPDVDFILWTRTGWDWPHYGISEKAAHQMQNRMLLNAARAEIPTVGMHLDIWWGLQREHQIHEEPFFNVDLMVTADGGHDQEWAKAGVNHVFFAPGVSLPETEPGKYRSDFASPLAFVGSWQGSYHAESEHRHALVRWLKQNFTRDCAFWPQPGQPAVRGVELRDLYQSVEVLVGDSCFTGTGLRLYHSDRVPESLGRGGYLIHPRVPGMEALYEHRVHMANWNAWEWEGLGAEIEWALSNPEERKAIAEAGREHVRKTATYEVRMRQLIDLLYMREMIAKPKKTAANKAAK